MKRMGNNNLEKFRRHLAKPVKFTLPGENGTEDEFEFKPMNVEMFTEFMAISEQMDKKPTTDMAKEMFKIYIKIICNSYPEISEEDAANFLMNNFEKLIGLFEKLMPVKPGEVDAAEVQKKIEMIRNNAKPSTEDTGKSIK